MPSSDVPTREQLTDAMDKIRHQLDVLRSGPTIGGWSDDRSVIAELEAEYEGLRQARTELG